METKALIKLPIQQVGVTRVNRHHRTRGSRSRLQYLFCVRLRPKKVHNTNNSPLLKALVEIFALLPQSQGLSWRHLQRCELGTFSGTKRGEGPRGRGEAAVFWASLATNMHLETMLWQNEAKNCSLRDFRGTILDFAGFWSRHLSQIPKNQEDFGRSCSCYWRCGLIPTTHPTRLRILACPLCIK